MQDARDTILRAHEAAPSRLLAIVGPTASGKTELALEVAHALGGEIVNADSIQIVRGFDLGSGKPSAEERAAAPHHLFDALDPLDPIDAAGYAKLADRVLEDVRARGKVPILVGGTFFWVRALLIGLVDAPSADASVRARHDEIVRTRGAAALHAELAQVDPESARRLHPNDALRVGRALEVFELSGKKQSELHAEHAFRTQRIEASWFARRVEPQVLDQRIEARARVWLDHGWLDEVRGLIERNYRDARAMGSVGYKEVLAHLEGRLPGAELLSTIVRATRIFARRQRTWLKSESRIVWL